MRKDDIMTLTREKDACPSDKFSRRKFFGTAAMAAVGGSPSGHGTSSASRPIPSGRRSSRPSPRS